MKIAILLLGAFGAACDANPVLLPPGAANGVDSGGTGSSGVAGSGSGDPQHMAGTAANAGASSNAGGTSSVGGSGMTGGADTGAAGGSGAMPMGGAAGAGSTEPVPYTALAVAIAEAHFCVLLDNHNVKCWGSGLYGELGDGSPEGVYPNEPQVTVNFGTGRTAKALSLGFHASCALLDDDSVKCWGFSQQTGVGAVEPIGDQPGELGDQWPAVDLGAGRTATQLTLGHAAGCAILDDGNARCWDNLPHETWLHEGAAVIQLANGHFPVALFEDGSYGSPESNERELAGSPALGIAGDSRNVCALLETGALSCTDSFIFIDPPTLDPAATTSFAIHGAYGSGALCTLDPQGVVRCRGNLDHPERWVTPGVEYDALTLTPVNLGAKAIQLASGGDRYECAVLEDGRVKCWGDPNRAGDYDTVDGEIRALDLGTH